MHKFTVHMNNTVYFNPWTYEVGGGGDELSSRPAVFSSCAYIPKTHFDTRLVIIVAMLEI